MRERREREKTEQVWQREKIVSSFAFELVWMIVRCAYKECPLPDRFRSEIPCYIYAG